MTVYVTISVKNLTVFYYIVSNEKVYNKSPSKDSHTRFIFHHSFIIVFSSPEFSLPASVLQIILLMAGVEYHNSVPQIQYHKFGCVQYVTTG